MQHSLYIQNRHNLRIFVCVDVPESKTAHGLAFIMPGLGSQHKKPEFRSFAEIMNSFGYIVVSLDPTHSFGMSDGLYEDATFTNYREDLEDVIEWARIHLDSIVGRAVYSEPFVLVGHSLGGMSVAYIAERYPKKIKALAPLSMTISGALSAEARGEDEMKKWKDEGFQFGKRSSGDQIRLKWSHMEDRFKYDMLQDAQKVSAPLLMIVGENDPVTPPRHQKLFFDTVSTSVDEKEIHIISGAGHELGKTDVLPAVKEIFRIWFSKIAKDNRKHTE